MIKQILFNKVTNKHNNYKNKTFKFKSSKRLEHIRKDKISISKIKFKINKIAFLEYKI